MTVSNKQFSIWAACMVASLAAAFAAAGASQAGSGPAQCEIAAKSSGGMVAIDALAHADGALNGTYRLTVSGNGTNINQAGEFDASAGETVRLGSATLGGSGSYNVKLDVTAGGVTAQCAERVGGWL